MTAVASRRQPRKRPNGLWAFPRELFAHEYFDYKPGEHVVFGGPTQRGKTTLAFEMLAAVATPELPAYVAVSKPRDPTTEKWGKRLGFRRVDTWPVPKKLSEIGGMKPRGYLIWPRFGNVHDDLARASEITRKLIMDRYHAGIRHEKGILMLDDTMVKSKILNLDSEMVTVLAMAGAMDVGAWLFVQKPTDSGRTAVWAYSQSEHLFLTHDPDRNSVKRYSEIGGYDPKTLAEALDSLQPYEFLYLKRTGSVICIIERN